MSNSAAIAIRPQSDITGAGSGDTYVVVQSNGRKPDCETSSHAVQVPPFGQSVICVATSQPTPGVSPPTQIPSPQVLPGQGAKSFRSQACPALAPPLQTPASSTSGEIAMTRLRVSPEPRAGNVICPSAIWPGPNPVNIGNVPRKQIAPNSSSS